MFEKLEELWLRVVLTASLLWRLFTSPFRRD